MESGFLSIIDVRENAQSLTRNYGVFWMI
ncbi:hypothetical protein Goari_015957 [Gossypium aridum]|uniref:Uncharacterized protein n=1 Tax=Gossypium aridum TaxID=34290 RepID=A0A7J8WI54_GOSAI|nr:hypothetical protein [Gossypium aridum]